MDVLRPVKKVYPFQKSEVVPPTIHASVGDESEEIVTEGRSRVNPQALTDDLESHNVPDSKED